MRRSLSPPQNSYPAADEKTKTQVQTFQIITIKSVKLLPKIDFYCELQIKITEFSRDKRQPTTP
ncbi:unnamed protein product, partial [Sphagnum jensenii]